MSDNTPSMTKMSVDSSATPSDSMAAGLEPILQDYSANTRPKQPAGSQFNMSDALEFIQNNPQVLAM